jgi:nitrate/nitrite transport system ATP-binding protein
MAPRGRGQTAGAARHPASNDRFLEISKLSKSFPGPNGPALVVDDFDLKIREGEFVCLLGHSGCGKSTVLSIAMGLTAATEGGVILGGHEVSGPGIDRGVVFQSPSLLPWLTAHENVLLAVDQAHPGTHVERRAIADHYLQLVGLGTSMDRRPRELSAGMQQRVGIARALALEPKVLLLDEPFSLLDIFTRMDLQDELLRIWERERRTVLMVTHDVDEALLLADRIVLMTNGPAATVGRILDVPLPRPRVRAEVLEDPRFFQARDEVLGFLEGGATRRQGELAA